MRAQFNSNKDLNCQPFSFKLSLQIFKHISKASLIENVSRVCKKVCYYVTVDK